jgi:Mrp family chromosome partitioning ATPase
MQTHKNGQLPATPIEIEPTASQRAAHALVSALTGSPEIDWQKANGIFSSLVEAVDAESPSVKVAISAAMDLYESLLRGNVPQPAELDAVRYTLSHAQRGAQIEVEDGIPTHYWQGWLIKNWLPRGCVSMLTGDGGVGKSRLALQLAWALSGGGKWLGETGQIPPLGADYGGGFEPMEESAIVYATWEDSPAQIKGRLYWLHKAGRRGKGSNFKIADMRSRGHLWTRAHYHTFSGLTPAGEALRQTARRLDARLLVIDTLGAANGASEIDRAQVGEFFAHWAAWADDMDCTVLLIAHPPKTPGVAYSGSTGMLGGVRGMWHIERVFRKCECDAPRNCTCKPSYAYRLVNNKQNYAPDGIDSVWLSNRNGVWQESPAIGPDYLITESSENGRYGNNV